MIRKLATCIATIAALTQVTANAADCKYEKNELDKFTKIRIIETDWERLSSLPGFFASFAAYASVRTKGDEKFLSMKFSATEHDKYRPREYELRNRFTIAEGAPLKLLLGDGSIVELQSVRGVNVNARFTDPGDMTYIEEYQIDSKWSVEYVLDESAIAALSAQDVTHMRIEGVTKYADPYDNRFDVWLREKMAGYVRNALECSR
jgi:hypothetical protein